MRTTMILTAQAILMAASLTAAENAPPQHMMRMYDPATETARKGIVEGVKSIHHGKNMTGIHLMLRTGGEVKEVMLGPSDFVTSKGFTFEMGDQVELIGSQVTMGEMKYIVAREVTKDGKTLTLRDKNGVPEWGGMGMCKDCPMK